MNDNDANQPASAPAAPFVAQVQAELERLAAEYPAFRFSTRAGWDRERVRWVAERIRAADTGVHTVITTDLGELRAALGDHPRRQVRALAG